MLFSHKSVGGMRCNALHLMSLQTSAFLKVITKLEAEKKMTDLMKCQMSLCVHVQDVFLFKYVFYIYIYIWTI